jgi:hypothetical protein
MCAAQMAAVSGANVAKGSGGGVEIASNSSDAVIASGEAVIVDIS